MNKTQQRSVALSAARSQLRKLGCLNTAQFNDVLVVLDDMMRSEPDLIASIWYSNASDNQIKMARREWNKRREY